MNNEDFGSIFFSEELSAVPVNKVQLAAEESGFDPDWIRDLKPRNIFIRAIRSVEQSGDVESGTDGVLCDKLEDSYDVIRFQFSRRYVEAQGAHYDPTATVTFYKDSSMIVCSNKEIEALAQSLYEKLKAVYRASDIQALVKRVVQKAGAKRILLRDGVYFLPLQYNELVTKLEKFFAKLGFSYHVYPVGTNSGDGKNIIKAVVRDIVKSVETLKTEIETLKADSSLTKRIAKSRIKELRESLNQYRELGVALNIDVSKLLEQAGEAGTVIETVGSSSTDDLIRSLQQGVKLSPIVYDLLAGAEEDAVSLIKLDRHVAQVVDAREDDQAGEPVQLKRKLEQVSVGD